MHLSLDIRARQLVTACWENFVQILQGELKEKFARCYKALRHCALIKILEQQDLRRNPAFVGLKKSAREHENMVSMIFSLESGN